jgi:GntR family transcriptional regulator/MocR family aminotransferase
LSKVLFPALRLAVVVPPSLIDRSHEVGTVGRHALGLDQAVLAEFVAEGHLGRHIRRIRRLYAKRQAIFVDLCRAASFGTVGGGAGGRRYATGRLAAGGS